MARPLTPEKLIAALKKWGVPFELYPGWKTRTRPGSCNPVGFIIHHTGGPFTESDAYLKFLFETGRPSEGIPGPLCQFAIGPSGTVYVGSIGRANQAGRGSSSTRTKVGTESYPGYSSEIQPGPDDIDGNAAYWGVEICYPGTVEMKPAQYRSAVLLGVAIVDAYGWSALSVIAHREHSRRKRDPFGVHMAKFRRDVRDRLAAGPGGATPEPEDDDMPDKATFQQWVANGVQIAVEKSDPVRKAIGEIASKAITNSTEIKYLRTQNRSIAGAVVALARGVELTPEELQAVVDAASGK